MPVVHRSSLKRKYRKTLEKWHLKAEPSTSKTDGPFTNFACIACRLQEYQSPALKEYFDQDALLFPLDTIIGKWPHPRLVIMLSIEKSEAKDFQFFLTQGNFLKVVDTLEKF